MGQEPLYTHNSRFPFIITTKDTVQQIPAFTDEEFYQSSQGVIFKVNRTEIPATDRFMTLYRDSVLPWVNAQHLQLRKVFVRGAASPEGSYAANQRLGKGRSEALLNTLKRDLAHQYIKIDSEVSSITEDYGYLCLLMKEAKDSDYVCVQTIYDDCKGDERCLKQALMAADHGKLWSRLNKKYFDRLRTARLILWFCEPDEEHAPEPVQPVVQTVVVEKPVPVVITSRDTVYVHDTLVVVRKTYIDSTIVVQRNKHDERALSARDTLLRHPILAVKSNLLFDLATLLNGEIEVPFAQRYSIVAECTWPWWLEKKHNKWCVEMGSVGLEGRYWFRKWKQHSTFDAWRRTKHAPLRGWFVGIYANCGYYDFQLKRHSGSQGEFAGAGLSIGYSTYLARNWRMEFSLAGGAAMYQDRKYFIEDNTATDPHRDQHLWKDGEEKKSIWYGPTKAKISISYLITGKCKKGGKR